MEDSLTTVMTGSNLGQEMVSHGSETPHSILVSEVFGPTFQGEGPSSGRRAGFIRLGGCNLACSWCDTPYTWDWTGKNGQAYNPRKELRWVDPHEILDSLRKMRVELVVITGGEPLLHKNRLDGLLAILGHSGGFSFEVETNGTIVPNRITADWVDQFNVSPKLEGSGNPADKRTNLTSLRWFAKNPKSVFKFVIANGDDEEEVDSLVQTVGINPETVWLMHEGTDRAHLQAMGPFVAQHALVRGYNFTTRMHIMLWGNQRGK